MRTRAYCCWVCAGGVVCAGAPTRQSQRSDSICPSTATQSARRVHTSQCWRLRTRHTGSATRAQARVPATACRRACACPARQHAAAACASGTPQQQQLMAGVALASSSRRTRIAPSSQQLCSLCQLTLHAAWQAAAPPAEAAAAAAVSASHRPAVVGRTRLHLQHNRRAGIECRGCMLGSFTVSQSCKNCKVCGPHGCCGAAAAPLLESEIQVGWTGQSLHMRTYQLLLV